MRLWAVSSLPRHVLPPDRPVLTGVLRPHFNAQPTRWCLNQSLAYVCEGSVVSPGLSLYLHVGIIAFSLKSTALGTPLQRAWQRQPTGVLVQLRKENCVETPHCVFDRRDILGPPLGSPGPRTDLFRLPLNVSYLSPRHINLSQAAVIFYNIRPGPLTDKLDPHLIPKGPGASLKVGVSSSNN